jgi:hypothetical protein
MSRISLKPLHIVQKYFWGHLTAGIPLSPVILFPCEGIICTEGDLFLPFVLHHPPSPQPSVAPVMQYLVIFVDCCVLYVSTTITPVAAIAADVVVTAPTAVT